jgi:hypothetical protein
MCDPCGVECVFYAEPWAAAYGYSCFVPPGQSKRAVSRSNPWNLPIAALAILLDQEAQQGSYKGMRAEAAHRGGCGNQS